MNSSRADFQPANEFSGSEATARCQPGDSISKPWKCCYPLRGAGPKDRGFLSTTPSAVVYFTRPQSLGPGGTVLTAQTSLSTPLLLPGSEELLPPGRGQGTGVYLSPFSVFRARASSSPGFWEGTLFREGEIPPGWHSLKLTKVKCMGRVGDRPGWKQMGEGREG